MELRSILESMGFTPGEMSETWKATMDGIHLSICMHPLKGIAIGFWHSSERTLSEEEIVICRDADRQEIAQALVQIHEKIHGK